MTLYMEGSVQMGKNNWIWKSTLEWFRRLRVLPFDPARNFKSTLMFEKFLNFFKKYFFDRSKNILSDFGDIFENLVTFPDFFKGPFAQMCINVVGYRDICTGSGNESFPGVVWGCKSAKGLLNIIRLGENYQKYFFRTFFIFFGPTFSQDLKNLRILRIF